VPASLVAALLLVVCSMLVLGINQLYDSKSELPQLNKMTSMTRLAQQDGYADVHT